MPLTDCRHSSNAEIYAKPRNWDVACAITQLKAGVALTEGQAALLGKAGKWQAIRHCIKEVLSRVKARGWSAEHTNGGHIKWRHRSGAFLFGAARRGVTRQ